jgi:chemotaxis protein MotB
MAGKKGDIIVITVEEEGHAAAHGGSWKVAYADFVTAMMALFLLMWLLLALKPQQKAQLSMYFKSPDTPVQETKDGKPIIGEVVNSKELVSRLDKPKRTQLAVAGKIKELLKDQKISPGSGLKVDDRGVSMELPSSALFAPGSANLTPAAEQMLDQAAEILKKNEVVLQVRGHADDEEAKGSQFPNKWVLSAARAAAAVRYISSRFTVPPARMQAVGYGDSRPLVPPDTPENRGKNRRIEIYYSPAEQGEAPI